MDDIQTLKKKTSKDNVKRCFEIKEVSSTQKLLFSIFIWKRKEKYGIVKKKERRNWMTQDLSNENVVHVKKGEIAYLQFRKLLEYQSILTHCFTLKPLNYIADESDRSKLVDQYIKIGNALDININHIVRAYQTHGTTVKEITSIQPNNTIYDDTGLKAVDGLITSQKEIFLSTVSADCLLFLFFDPIKRVIANVHSGWRGTLGKIAQKAVYEMIASNGCRPEDIICCFCPSIGVCHFEVHEDVQKSFYDTFYYTGNIQEIIKPIGKVEGKEKWVIDTVLINQILLQEIGLKKNNIIFSNICSNCHCDLIHSRRKDSNSGRNTAIIGFR